MQNTKWVKHLPALGIAAFAVLAVVGVFLLKHFFQGDNTPQKKMIQQITVITPPPPPPPPPPEQIKQPELKEQIKEAETPPDKPQEQSADKSPAVEQDPNASGDGPTIAAGTGGGIGRGFGGSYEQSVRQEINEAIVQHERLKRMEYIAIVSLRLADNGDFETVDVEMVSGNSDAKAFIEDVLRKKKRMSKPRPLEAASFVKLRIKSIL
ncbi:MAG: TonB C-terminal domain-containing protein [Spongiibacteraceae bacterium]